jgi:hypothetical protein
MVFAQGGNEVKNIFLFLACALTPACWAGSVPPPALVNFENVPPGTQFGMLQGDAPGDLVLSQNGIDMRLRNFHFESFIGFFRADVGGAFDEFFPTTPLEINNIAVEFDFGEVGYPVTEVTLVGAKPNRNNSAANFLSCSLWRRRYNICNQ